MTDEIKNETGKTEFSLGQIIDQVAEGINQAICGDDYESLALKVVRLEAELAFERERVKERDKMIEMLRANSVEK